VRNCRLIPSLIAKVPVDPRIDAFVPGSRRRLRPRLPKVPMAAFLKAALVKPGEARFDTGGTSVRVAASDVIRVHRPAGTARWIAGRTDIVGCSRLEHRNAGELPSRQGPIARRDAGKGRRNLPHKVAHDPVRAVEIGGSVHVGVAKRIAQLILMLRA